MALGAATQVFAGVTGILAAFCLERRCQPCAAPSRAPSAGSRTAKEPGLTEVSKLVKGWNLVVLS